MPERLILGKGDTVHHYGEPVKEFRFSTKVWKYYLFGGELVVKWRIPK